jgi:hypothetical protein
VPEFHKDLVSRMRAENAEVLKKIADGSWDDDVVEEVHAAVEDFAKDFGQDIDEDGVAIASSSEAEPAASTSSSSDDDAETETADEPEKEAAPA